MHQLRFQTITILSLVFCGSAAAYQETPETKPSQKSIQATPDTLSTSMFQPYIDRLRSENSSDLKPSLASNERVVGGDTILIAWSEKLDELRGFSTKLGDWRGLKIPPQKSIVPKVSTFIAVVELEGAIAGFSATNGYWDVIELPKGVPAETLVHTKMLTVQTPEHLYTFAADKGQWTSPTDPELQPVSETITVSDSDKMRNGGIYDQFQKWVESLPRHQARGFSLTGSSGVVRLDASRQSLMKAAKQKLSEWGYIGDGSTSQPSPAELEESLKYNRNNATSPSSAAVSELSVDALRGELEKLESALVDQLRSRDESQDSKAKLAELRPQAEKAFDLRQQVLRLEAQRLETKLKSIQESLQAREKSRDDLVSKRLKELGSAPKNSTSSTKAEEISKEAPGTPATIVQASGGYFEQVTSIARTLRALRGDALAIRQDWLPHDNLIQTYSRPLADLIADGTVSKETTEADLQNQIARSRPMHEVKGKELAAAMKVWKQAWSSYKQQVELLNLEVVKKKNDLESLITVADNTRALYQNGTIPGSELAEIERQVKRVEIEVQQAIQIRQLFVKIVADEPELIPDHDQK